MKNLGLIKSYDIDILYSNIETIKTIFPPIYTYTGVKFIVLYENTKHCHVHLKGGTKEEANQYISYIKEILK